jgi:hypothetical protein
MTLLEVLVERMKMYGGIDGAKVAHFAFSDDGVVAFLSEIEEYELIMLLEEWCRVRREGMGSIH